MAAKAAKKQKPEDMLIRVIRVAEILAKGDTNMSDQATSKAKSVDSGIRRAVSAQKTQP